MPRRVAAIAASSIIVLAACGSDSSSSDTTAATVVETTTTVATEPGTVVEVAQATADFSTLVSAITAAGLAGTLSGEGPFTVFAPTNAAFAALPVGLLDKLLLPENKEILAKILTYHVVAKDIPAAEVMAGTLTTVEGSTIEVTTDGAVMVNDATVTATDVPASNGVIHVIDKVIIPPTVDVAAL